MGTSAALLARAWAARYVVLGPRCGYRPTSWAATLDRVMQRPPGEPGTPAAWQGAVAGAELAARRLLVQQGGSACESLADGTGLAAMDQAVAAAPAAEAASAVVEPAALPAGWLETAWPEAMAALLVRCGLRDAAWQANARAKLRAGTELWARAEGQSRDAGAREDRGAVADGALDMLDSVGRQEVQADGSVCATAAQSAEAADLDRLVALGTHGRGLRRR